jgi:hypothetical protein
MNRLLRILLLTFLPLSPYCSFGAIATYSFMGAVPPSFGGGTPYGLSIPNGTAVSGQFVYDTSAPASSTAGNLSIYPQSFVGGFSATFGSIPITASDYTIHVLNDQLQPNSTVADVVIVEWNSNDSPAPATPLNANGTSQSVGIFSISLFYPSSTFPDFSLPSSLPISGFNGFLAGSLSHVAPPGTVDVLYSVTKLVPEPATWAICLSGVLTLSLARFLKRGRQ